MELTALLLFAGAVVIAVAPPGPAITALVARVLDRGTSGAVAFLLGLSAGDLAWLTAAVLGLVFIAHTFALAFLAVKYLGAGYLIYLGYRMWTESTQSQQMSPPREDRPWHLFLTGFSLVIGNPKAMVFYLALLPNVIDLTRITLVAYLQLMAITFIVCTVIDGSYVLLAAKARSFISNSRSKRFVKRAAAAFMAGAAVAVIFTGPGP